MVALLFHSETDSHESAGFVSRAVEMCKANGEHVTEWRGHLFEKRTVAQLLTGLSSRRLGFDSRTIIFQKAGSFEKAATICSS
jgi:hypothetical protein